MQGTGLELGVLERRGCNRHCYVRPESAAAQPAALDTPWKSIMTVILLLLFQGACLLIRMYDKFKALPVRTWVLTSNLRRGTLQLLIISRGTVTITISLQLQVFSMWVSDKVKMLPARTKMLRTINLRRDILHHRKIPGRNFISLILRLRWHVVSPSSSIMLKEAARRTTLLTLREVIQLDVTSGRSLVIVLLQVTRPVFLYTPQDFIHLYLLITSYLAVTLSMRVVSADRKSIQSVWSTCHGVVCREQTEGKSSLAGMKSFGIKVSCVTNLSLCLHEIVFPFRLYTSALEVCGKMYAFASTN